MFDRPRRKTWKPENIAGVKAAGGGLLLQKE